MHIFNVSMITEKIREHQPRSVRRVFDGLLYLINGFYFMLQRCESPDLERDIAIQ
jgi:hypothetical protein